MPGRRPISDWPHLVGKQWNDLLAREIQDFFARLVGSSQGLPSGFSATPGTPLGSGSTGDAGDPTTGWAAADHVHPSELTSKGDSLTHDGGTIVREAVGADGTFLMADSTEDSGRRWAEPPSLGTSGGSTERLESHLLRVGIEAYATRVLHARNFR